MVEGGKATSGGAYTGQKLDWDMRAAPENWDKWRKNGLGMAAVGMAYVGGKLKFLAGDYGAMIKNPNMASPFLKSFSVMGLV